MRKIILASASPRRKDILSMTGLNFTVCESNYEEVFNLSLSPGELATFLSRKKAEAVVSRYRNALIIAADTFIVFKNILLGKPLNDRDAGKMLGMLSGKGHSVITGFTIIDTASNKKLSRSVETKVYFRKLICSELVVIKLSS